jgi:hypothetical protein
MVANNLSVGVRRINASSDAWCVPTASLDLVPDNDNLIRSQ